MVDKIKITAADVAKANLEVPLDAENYPNLMKDSKEIGPVVQSEIPARPTPVTVKSPPPPASVAPPRSGRSVKSLATSAAPGEIPPQPRGATLTAEEFFDGIQAESLQLPNFSVDPKSANPNVMFRWVNFKVGEEESSLRYSQMKAGGFVNATKNDVQADSPALSYWKEDKQAFINYDLILMKIDRRRYLGFIKGNMENAKKLGSRMNLTAQGSKSVRDAIRDSGASADLAKKVSTFIPKDKELGEVFEGDEDQPIT